MADQLRRRTGSPNHVIGTVLADAGYASDANLAAPGPDRLVALSKSLDQAKDSRTTPGLDPAPTEATPRQLMRHRLRTAEGARLYNVVDQQWTAWSILARVEVDCCKVQLADRDGEVAASAPASSSPTTSPSDAGGRSSATTSSPPR